MTFPSLCRYDKAVSKQAAVDSGVEALRRKAQIAEAKGDTGVGAEAPMRQGATGSSATAPAAVKAVTTVAAKGAAPKPTGQAKKKQKRA